MGIIEKLKYETYKLGLKLGVIKAPKPKELNLVIGIDFELVPKNNLVKKNIKKRLRK